MPFIHVARSLDELLFEVMTWLIFYPVTLWRSVRHPLATMQYAHDELAKKDAPQFAATLRPPLFLLVTVMLAYAVELAAVGESPVITSDIGVADLIDDNQSVMIYRIVAFALFPVAMAAIETALARQPITREGLHEPFYAQCFLAAPFVLVLCLAGTAIRRPEPWLEPAAFVVALISSALYVAAETAWLVRSTAARWMRALGAAIGGFAACALIVWTLATLIGGD
jgi:hypothetical protein